MLAIRGIFNVSDLFAISDSGVTQVPKIMVQFVQNAFIMSLG